MINKGYILFVLIILGSFLVLGQGNKKSFLSLSNDSLRFDHVFKQHRKITVWINDSTSYCDYFKIVDSNFISLSDTLIAVDEIKQLQGINKRRRIGAPIVIITPFLIGLSLEVILLFYDDSFFKYFSVPTLSGIGGGLIGIVVAGTTMNKKFYRINPGDLQIISN